MPACLMVSWPIQGWPGGRVTCCEGGLRQSFTSLQTPQCTSMILFEHPPDAGILYQPKVADQTPESEGPGRRPLLLLIIDLLVIIIISH
jgi:hypothetical protein